MKGYNLSSAFNLWMTSLAYNAACSHPQSKKIVSVFKVMWYIVDRIKWRVFSQPSKIGPGKNDKSLFFLLGLKITLKICCESKNFCQIPVLRWEIRYSVFQKLKFTSRLQKWADNFNSNYWHLVVKFGQKEWF